MGFFVLILIVAVIWLLSEMSGLKAAVGRLEAKLVDMREELHAALSRLQRLESGTRRSTTTLVEPDRVEPVVQPAEAPRATAPAAPIVVPPAPVVEAPEPAPVVVAPEPVPTIAAATQAARAIHDAVDHAPAAPPMAAFKAVPADRDESWEMVVGTSWLNKIGVLVSIVGVALLVSYSFAHIGPTGRVAIGYLLSATMLAGGVVLERRAPFRNYAYGLIAGGWAGIYFTTFAMHDVPAAKIIDNDLLAVTLLSLVAAGMIAHSVRYRSQVVTSLAFIVAYTTLALSPLSGFALAASVPLAVAMLVVAQYFGWSSIAVLGIAATYGTFVIRSEVFPGTGIDRESLLPYTTLGTYWLAFEAAEIIALWRRRHLPPAAQGVAPVSMLALNLVGFVGAVIITAPGDNPELFSTFLFGTSVAYIVSAAVRASLAPEWRARPGSDAPFNSTHAATAAAAGLTAVAIGFRFHDHRQTLARLFEAELLVSAGLLLGDVWLRRIGSIALVLAGITGWIVAADFSARASHLALWGFTPATASVVLSLIAIAAYGNREALHRRREALVWFEGGYTWMATLFVTAACLIEFSPAHWAIAVIVLGYVLLETGFRRTPEYIYQAYLAGLFGAYGIFVSFIARPEIAGIIGSWVAPTSADEWLVLPAAIMVAGVAAWRLFTRPIDAPIPGRLAAAGVSAALATAFLVVFEWRVLAPNAIAPAWALTAVGLVLLGAWRRLPGLRWQGYAVVSLATMRAIQPLLDAPPESTTQTAAIAVVIAAIYAAGYWGRRALFAESPDARTAESPEAAITAALGLVATGTFVLFKWRVLPEITVAPAWAATGVVLLLLGVYRSRAGQRWQGYALLALGSMRVLGLLLDNPAAAADLAWWSAAVIGLTYAGAWFARASAARTKDPAILSGAISAIATLVFAVLQSRVLEELQIGPAWTATAVVLLALGFRRRAADLRWQSYALLAAGAWRAGQQVFGTIDPSTGAIVWLGAVIAALYACGLVARRDAASARQAGSEQPVDDTAGALSLLGATATLAALIGQQVEPSGVTLALGLQGLGLMFGGLVARERVLRLSGLALLLGCILKLFLYDLRQLEALARIVSFVILGLSLLAISWTYTRYREQIRKFL